MFIRPLAEACWSEYVANRLSSATANHTAVEAMTSTFADALLRTKADIDSEIRSYRYHADLDRLMSLFQRHGEFLVRSACYVLGYIDGLNKPIEVLSADAAEALTDSYFEKTWLAVQEALREMYLRYPKHWKDLTVYDGLAHAIEEYYDMMGLVLSTTDDGRAYVSVPFRPGTI